MTPSWPIVRIVCKTTTVLLCLLFVLQCKGNSSDGSQDRIRSRSSDGPSMKEAGEENKDEENKSEDENSSSGDGDGESGEKNSSQPESSGSDARPGDKSFNNAQLASMLTKQKSQGNDDEGNCGGSRVVVSDECYSTLEYCGVLNFPPNKYVPDTDSKSCRLATNSCRPYQEVKTVTVKLDKSKTTNLEICQDSQTLCTSPKYQWEEITDTPLEELNFQYHGGGRCMMTDAGCKAQYAGSSLVEGQNICTPTPQYCMDTEAEKKFFKGTFENDVYTGECVTEKNFTATAETCQLHGMLFNAAAQKCYHNTQEGCTSVKNIWLSAEQMSSLERLHSEYTSEMTTFDDSTSLVDFYKNEILPNQAQYIESSALNSSVQCQSPSVYSCQLPENMVYDSAKNTCTDSFRIILYLRVKKFDFDFNADCNDAEKWWNYDTDSMYVKQFYVNIQSRTTQIDGITLVTNGLKDQVKFSNNMTHKYYDYHKSFVVDVTNDFTIEVRPEVYRKSGTSTLWLNGEKKYKFTDGNNWDLSTTHEEIFEQTMDINGKSCKARLTFEWRWFQIQ